MYSDKTLFKFEKKIKKTFLFLFWNEFLFWYESSFYWHFSIICSLVKMFVGGENVLFLTNFRPKSFFTPKKFLRQKIFCANFFQENYFLLKSGVKNLFNRRAWFCLMFRIKKTNNKLLVWSKNTKKCTGIFHQVFCTRYLAKKFLK